MHMEGTLFLRIALLVKRTYSYSLSRRELTATKKCKVSWCKIPLSYVVGIGSVLLPCQGNIFKMDSA